MWAGLRYSSKTPAKIVFWGPKLGKNAGGREGFSAEEPAPTTQKIKNPVMLFGIFGILGPIASLQHSMPFSTFGLVLGLCFGALGCQRVGGSTPPWASGFGWWVGWPVCWMLAKY